MDLIVRMLSNWALCRIFGYLLAMVCAGLEGQMVPGKSISVGQDPEHVQLSTIPARFSITLPGAQLIRVTGVCPNSTLDITLIQPNGQLAAKASSAGGTGSEAETVVIAPATGQHILEAKLSRKAPSLALCQIAVSPGGEITEAGRKIADAYRTWTEAQTTETASPLKHELLERTLRQAESASETQLALAASVALAQWSGAQRKFADGVAAAQHGLSLKAAFLHPRLRAQLLYYQGVMKLQYERPETAAPLLREAATLQLSLGQAVEQGQSLHNLSVADWELGECENALGEAQRALTFRKQLDDPGREAYSLLAVANSFLCLGKAQEALDTYGRALSLWQQVKDRRNEASVLNDEGVLYASLGDNEKARALHRQALEIRESLHDSMGLVESEYNLGDLELASNHVQDAVPHLHRSLEFAQTAPFRRGEAYALRGLGQAAFQTGKQAEALGYLNKSIQISAELGDRNGEAWSQFALSKLRSSVHDLDRAKAALDRALLLERETGDRLAQPVMLVALADVLEKQGHAERALTSVDEAIRLIEEGRSALLAPGVRVNFLASKRKAYELRISLLSELGESSSVARAFQTSEQAHARVLLDALPQTEGPIPGTTDTELTSELRRLDADINANADALGRLPAASKAQSERLKGDIDKLIAGKEEVKARIRQADPGFAALHFPVPSPLEEVRRELLDSETLLLEYFVGAEHSYVWAVTKTDAMQFSVPPNAVLQGYVGALLHCLTERNRTSTSETLAARKARFERADREARRDEVLLGKELLGPVRRLLHVHRVLVIPDGPLHTLPFSALRLPDGASLGAGREIVLLPSASVLVEMRRQPAAIPQLNPALVIADPVFSESDIRLGDRTKSAGRANELPRIPGSADEAATLRELVGKTEIVQLLGFQANLEAWRRPDLNRFGLIHIGAHTRIDSARPELSGIVLSQVRPDGTPQPGLLRLHDIYDLRLRAKLVVLSACETSYGKEMSGEGLATLSRGFLYSGARSVIGTLWSVDDEATALFMRRFYQVLWQRGTSASHALAEAKRWMQAQPRWNAAYYWAAFTIAGDWR